MITSTCSIFYLLIISTIFPSSFFGVNVKHRVQWTSRLAANFDLSAETINWALQHNSWIFAFRCFLIHEVGHCDSTNWRHYMSCIQFQWLQITRENIQKQRLVFWVLITALNITTHQINGIFKFAAAFNEWNSELFQADLVLIWARYIAKCWSSCANQRRIRCHIITFNAGNQQENSTN